MVTTTPTPPTTERSRLLRNLLIAAVTAIVVALGITWQVVAATSHSEGKPEPGSSATHDSGTNDQAGKPGEVKPDQPDTSVEPSTTTEGKTEGDTTEHTGKPGEQKP